MSSSTTAQINKLNYCEGEYKTEQMIQSKITTVVLAIFFVSLLGVGMGQTAVYTLGIPYIDDNVASRESPLYFGKWINRILKHSHSQFPLRIPAHGTTSVHVFGCSNHHRSEDPRASPRLHPGFIVHDDLRGFVGESANHADGSEMGGSLVAW